MRGYVLIAGVRTCCSFAVRSEGDGDLLVRLSVCRWPIRFRFRFGFDKVA
jgi:hypothetical protein